MTEMKLKMLVNTKVCLQHFGFSFAVVSSFSGWPTVKLKALLQAPCIPLERGNVPDGERSDEGTSEPENFGPQRGRRALTEQ
ncbi:hypothetical protein TNCV_1846791 [Trichonephila clavipes]|nr:hypothetical protein TNCV_1846791 [Trichonephila clavipes]